MRAKTVETLTDQAFTGAPTAIDAQQCLVRFYNSPQNSLTDFSSAASCRPSISISSDKNTNSLVESASILIRPWHQPRERDFMLTKNTNYRPDIDGLRAIAVLSVILYHFKVPFFTGGFVGVDVFFVISGYLITKGILDKQKQGKFDFSDFYYRRVRRLIPALLATITACYIAAFFLYSPLDFKQMSGSTVYALIGASNIFFWLESGYFDSAAAVKPLLHTWSLSVEIQFYILWPLILLALTKLTKHTFIATLGITTLGCIAAVWYLNIDASGAFYLTPFRFNEFLFGGLVVFLERSLGKNISDVLYGLGLGLIGYSVFLFNSDSTLFPGLSAMVPAAGAALMILAGSNARLALPCKSAIATKIGERSYSLYLVHWPIYVFTSYILISGISSLVTAGLIVATFITAELLYQLIEKPFRNPQKPRLTGLGFSLSTLACSTAIIVVAANSWGQGGWDWRIPEEIRTITKINKPELDTYVWAYHKSLDAKAGFDPSSNKEKILIIGDSQAADIANMLNESGYTASADVVSRIIVTDCAAPYIPNDEFDTFFNKVNTLTIQRPELVTPCEDKITRAVNQQLLDSADKVFIAFHWQPFATEYNLRGIQKITTMTNAKVFVFGRKNLSKSSIDIVTALGRTSGLSHYAASFKNEGTQQINNALSKIEGTTFIDMMKVTCPENDSCAVLTQNNKPIFFDPAHLTKDGAIFLGSKLVAELGGR